MDTINLIHQLGPELKLAEQFHDLEMLKAYPFEERGVDLVFFALSHPVSGCMDWIIAFKEIHAHLSVVLITMNSDQAFIKTAFLSGISGYFLRDTPEEEFRYGLSRIVLGISYISSILFIQVISGMLEPVIVLTVDEKHYDHQEIVLMQYLADGLNNFKIAEKLFLSPRSVESRRAALIRKTETINTANLIRYGMVHGLIK